MVRLLENEEILDKVPSKLFRSLASWMVDNIFQDSIFSVESWLEIAFHLCKQRWDSSLDWLENQPMSKIKVMIDINQRFVEAQKPKGKRK